MNVTLQQRSLFKRRRFFQLNFKDVMGMILSTILPIAIGIHTVIVTRQQAEFNHELRQQNVYDQFLENMYKLHTTDELNTSAGPWAFANAFYRSAHRQWDLLRKQQSLLFLKEKELIGRRGPNGECLSDIIRLRRLNFDGIRLESSGKNLFKIDLTCVQFDEVSFDNAILTGVDLEKASFNNSRFNGVVFENTSLVEVFFNHTQLSNTDLTTTDISGSVFIGIDLSETKITKDQIDRAEFQDVKMPDTIDSDSIHTTRSKSSYTFNLLQKQTISK